MFHRTHITTCWLLLAAVGMMWLPSDMQAALRLAVGDAIQPGCRLWTATQSSISTLAKNWQAAPEDHTSEVRRLRDDLEDARQQARHWQIQLAQQHESNAANHPPLFADASDPGLERLAQPVAIAAAVLGESHAQSWRKGRWLDQGKSAGLIEEAPILTSTEPLVDIGRDAQVSAEDTLLWGRSVIGKVHQVGRWTSTFLLVTDAAFRGRAQLVRETPDGYRFGSKGILKGQGEALCRLDGIPASDTVEVGDSVYTAERDGLLPTPFYYGQVVEATLEDHAKEWRIRVQPVDLDSLTKVHVLRTSLNPRRLLAN